MEGKTSMVDDLENNWKTLETRFLEQKYPEGGNESNKRSARDIRFTFCFPQHKHAS
jgi:hypothetical protein